jgi:Glycosyltransferase family 6
LFVDRVNKEILSDLVGVQHCGFFQRIGPYEENPNSVFYVQDRSQYRQYYGGGFSGGKKANYLALSSWCNDMIDKDVSNGIIPIWHDETAINRYFLDHPPLSLTPSYHYPQSNIERYKKMWGGNVFHPRIMLPDKDHHNIRQ